MMNEVRDIMVMPNIFSLGLDSQSKDANIYTSFEPYLYGVLGIDQETFMKDKNLRRSYQQKFAMIKSKFQEETASTVTDTYCHNRIKRLAREWQDVIVVATENLADNGEEFIKNTPLDRYILMTDTEKRNIESQLTVAALERIRSIFQKDSKMTNSNELETMLQDTSTSAVDERSHKI